MDREVKNGLGARAKVPHNFWKIAFFIALFGFELARETAVLEASQGALPTNNATLSHLGWWVRAQGSWKRIDGGAALIPGTVTIECQRETGRCFEASVLIHGRYISAPEIAWFDARFTPEAVSYENNQPDCARYSVRLDLKMEKVFALRERKDNPANPNCAKLERRVEMQLGDGFDPSRTLLDEHFVPIMRALAYLNGPL